MESYPHHTENYYLPFGYYMVSNWDIQNCYDIHFIWCCLEIQSTHNYTKCMFIETTEIKQKWGKQNKNH